jgi:glycogen debranching enzyme
MDYLVIKENDLFLTTDRRGDIPSVNPDGLGLYAQDTRFLSRMEMLINGRKPVLLSSSAESSYGANMLLTNEHMEEEGGVKLWRESIEFKRSRFIHNGALHEKVELTNYSSKPIEFDFSVYMDADFQDMFMVRGFAQGDSGTITSRIYEFDHCVISYLGTDGRNRETRIVWDYPASSVEDSGAIHFHIQLDPMNNMNISFCICPYVNGEVSDPSFTNEGALWLEDSYNNWTQLCTQVNSDYPLFNNMLRRSIKDLRMLMTDLGYGQFPVAGVPWFAVPFGRDSLITALQMLPLNPIAAKGTLLTMSAYQGKEVNDWRDEQPGKIMHELRRGELANTSKVPFNPYYGTIDSTPLFLVLLVEYYHWSGDLELVRHLLPNIRRALEWIKLHGDNDGDGFVEYACRSCGGIANQGWKDSGDSIIHENGEFAEPSIALVEVQGYVYHGQVKLPPILRLLGENGLAQQLEEEASMLRQNFEHRFWMEDHDYYALALDGHKEQVRSITSNPGHLLLSGIMASDRAAHVAGRLVREDLFSGYGIRTKSTKSAGYNPMSYHNGSVWPHDNSISLLGLSRAGFTREVEVIVSAMMHAAEGFEYTRLPELFCGYDQNTGSPIPYPVACSPQAWAAGTTLTFIQALLGICPDAISRSITLNPTLPSEMNHLSVSGMKIGNGVLSIELHRNTDSDSVSILISENTTGYSIQNFKNEKGGKKK